MVQRSSQYNKVKNKGVIWRNFTKKGKDSDKISKKQR